jgi:hypothetical protein
MKTSKDGKFYSFIDGLQIITKKAFREIAGGSFIFGNALLNLPPQDSSVGNNAFKDEKKVISSPNAEYIARWAERFGEKLLTYNYEFMEPDYLKDFIIKNKGKKI